MKQQNELPKLFRRGDSLLVCSDGIGGGMAYLVSKQGGMAGQTIYTTGGAGALLINHYQMWENKEALHATAVEIDGKEAIFKGMADGNIAIQGAPSAAPGKGDLGGRFHFDKQWCKNVLPVLLDMPGAKRGNFDDRHETGLTIFNAREVAVTEGFHLTRSAHGGWVDKESIGLKLGGLDIFGRVVKSHKEKEVVLTNYYFQVMGSTAVGRVGEWEVCLPVAQNALVIAFACDHPYPHPFNQIKTTAGALTAALEALETAVGKESFNDSRFPVIIDATPENVVLKGHVTAGALTAVVIEGATSPNYGQLAAPPHSWQYATKGTAADTQLTIGMVDPMQPFWVMGAAVGNVLVMPCQYDH